MPAAGWKLVLIKISSKVRKKQQLTFRQNELSLEVLYGLNGPGMVKICRDLFLVVSPDQNKSEIEIAKLSLERNEKSEINSIVS